MFITKERKEKKRKEKKFLEVFVLPKKDNKQIINRGLCWEGMGKVGKTFTLDLQVLAWLADYAKKNNKKESAVVNELLSSAKRQAETWTCSICDGNNHISEIKCWASKDCKGVKA